MVNKPHRANLHMTAWSVDTLETLAAELQTTKSDIASQSLRLFREVIDRLAKGETLCFRSESGEITQVCLLGMGPKRKVGEG